MKCVTKSLYRFHYFFQFFNVFMVKSSKNPQNISEDFLRFNYLYPYFPHSLFPKGWYCLAESLFIYPTSTIRIIEIYDYLFFEDGVEKTIFSDTQTIVSWMSDIWLHISSGFDWIFYDLIEFLIKTQKKRLIAFLQEFYHGFRETIVVHYFDFDAMSLVRNSFPSTLSPFLYSSIAISNLLFFLVLLLVFMESPIR